jgi:hypothetical protein
MATQQQVFTRLRRLSNMPDAPRLTPAARLTLFALTAYEKPLTLGILCDFTGVAPATLYRFLPQLIEAGIVARTRIAGQLRYSLTPRTAASAAVPTVTAEEAI